MGGIGSGRQWINTKVLTTDCKKLDVLELSRAGALQAGLSGHINWSDQDAGHVCFHAVNEHLILTRGLHIKLTHFRRGIRLKNAAVPLLASSKCPGQNIVPITHQSGSLLHAN